MNVKRKKKVKKKCVKNKKKSFQKYIFYNVNNNKQNDFYFTCFVGIVLNFFDFDHKF